MVEKKESNGCWDLVNTLYMHMIKSVLKFI